MYENKICYVLPEYSIDTALHYYHIYKFLDDISHSLNIILFIEKSIEKPQFNYIRNIYVQKYRHFLLSITERFIIFLLLRFRGYKKYYIHQSHISALIASIITKIAGGKTFFWNCGLRRHNVPKIKLNHQTIIEKIRSDYLFQFTIKIVDFFVTGTPIMAKYYCNNYGIKMNKIRILPNWVDLDRFNPEKFDKKGLKTQLGLCEDKKVILFVHWLSKRKGAQYISEIAKRVLAEIPVSLVVVGDGPYRERLENEIEANGLEEVKLLGKIPNRKIQEIYAIADVFIMPSLDEGFPRVLLESMAMNVPFVAFDVGGVRDIVPEDDEYFIVKRGDVLEFSLKVIELLKDGSPSNFREFLNNIYDKETVINKYINIISSSTTNEGRVNKKSFGV